MAQFPAKISARLRCWPYYLAQVTRFGFPVICVVNHSSSCLFQPPFSLYGVSSFVYIFLSCGYGSFNELFAFGYCEVLISSLFLIRSLSAFLILLWNKDHARWPQLVLQFFSVHLAWHILVCEILQNYYGHGKDSRSISRCPFPSMM